MFLSPGKRSAAVLSLAVLTSACGPTSYMRATGAYAKAVKSSSDAFSTSLDAALAQCHRRAELDRAKRLMEGLPALKDNKGWPAHCADVATSLKLQRRAGDALGEYAAALKALSDGAKYEGDGGDSAAAAAAELAGTLKDKESAEAKYAGAIGEPLKLLATFILVQWATIELKQSIAQTAPHLRKLLAAMGAYLDALEAQQLVFETEATELLSFSEKRLRENAAAALPPAASVGPTPPWLAPPANAPTTGTPRVPPLDAIQFVREVDLLTREVARGQQTVVGLRKVVEDLGKAQDRLEKAGEKDEEELKALIQSLVEVGKSAQGVVAAAGVGK